MMLTLTFLGCGPSHQGESAPDGEILSAKPTWSDVVARGVRMDHYQPWSDADGGIHLTHGGVDMALSWDGAGTHLSPLRHRAFSVQITTTATGRDTMRPTSAGPVAAGACSGIGHDAFGDCLRRVERPLGHGVRGWWANTDRGPVQGWTLDRVDGEGPLNIDISFVGMTATPTSADTAEVFNDSARFEYGELAAWDADQKPLPSRMEDSPSGLRIVVDVDNAAWPVTVDPLSTAPDWVATGQAEQDAFGISVSDAGDVNGDGYDDVLVGAPAADPLGRIDAGTVYLFLGGASGLQTTASWSRFGRKAEDAFGTAVAGVGDVNGDGFDDVLISSPLAVSGGNNKAGKVYLYPGSASGLNGTSWVKGGESRRDLFGAVLSGAGDVDADGKDDVIIGAPAANPGGLTGAGTAYVYRGRAAGLHNSHTWKKSGALPLTGFGSAVTGGGDFDGDGFDDVVVASGVVHRVEMFEGQNSGVSNTPSWTKTGSLGDLFGFAIAAVGDVNGDGFDDLAVSAPRSSSNGLVENGEVLLYRGRGAGLRPDPATRFQGLADGDHLGDTIGGAGDLNADGFDDLVIGAQDADQVAQNATGWAQVHLGSTAGLSSTLDWSASGTESNDAFGSSVSGAGDVNGDGADDLIVGAAGANLQFGAAYVYHGTPPPLPVSVPGGPYTGAEGSNIAVDGTNSYHLGGSVVAWRWDCDSDGDEDAAGASANCTYDDNGIYTITLEVEGDDGQSATASTTATVSNVSPIPDAGPDRTADEGDTLTFSGTFTDPGAADTHLLRWNCNIGDGFVVTPTASMDCLFVDDGVYNVRFRVTDDDGGQGTNAAVTTIANLAPTVDAGPNRQGNPTVPILFSGTATDPGVLDVLTFAADCGDGSPPHPVAGPSFSCTYTSAGLYTVTLTADDGDGGVGSDTATADVDGVDDDGDGFQAQPFGGDDCDDKNPQVHPGAPDSLGDGVDQDCDGADGVLLRASDLQPGDLRLTEVHDAPHMALAPAGLWFELENLTGQYVELEGLEIIAGGNGIVPTTDHLAPTGFVVIGHSAVDNGGAPVDIALPGILSTANVAVHSPTGTFLDNAEGLDTTGTSTNIDAFGDRCPSRSPFGDGDFGTPGEPSHACDWTVEASFQWFLDGAPLADATVTYTFDHSTGMFATDNSGQGTWSLTSGPGGQTLTMVNTDTDVGWSSTRDFGTDCWAIGTMFALPPGFTGTWTTCL